MRIFHPRVIFSLISLTIIILVSSWFVEQSILAQGDISLTLFSLVHLAGYFFFLLLPVEAFYFAMLTDGAPPGTLLLIALVTGSAAQIFDFFVGRLLPEKKITYLIGKKQHRRSKDLVHRYGYMAVLLLTLSPFSSPIVVLIAGMMRLKFRYVFIYTLGGLFVKYLAINAFYWFIWPTA